MATQERPSTYEKDWEVNFTHCYANGLIKFSEISNMLQITAGEHAIAAGFGFFEMANNNQAWVLSRIRMEVEELPKWLDHITIKTWIQEFQGARSIRNFEVWRKGKRYLTATTYWAVINTLKRTSEDLAIPTVGFETYPLQIATSKPFSRLDIQRDTAVVKNHQVVLSDLDIVKHVNNVKYMEWCLDTLKPELVLENNIRALEMNYLRELRYDDWVEISSSHTDNEIFFKIKKDEKISFLMQIELK
ncbi:acyl-[acyl-carrier-protein] thioesterase [Sphingobacterium sp. SYP-B4668]|uniref:acyl-[acyl-carrier-protein] thioesterase n=1 Tax=Sphingobacterium sp. SYP-B4668 TaxID=2996035 RepID=UPI0022DD3111|nr:acyl-ACP thioesterase domain-containing protein [Sphingobacterium sp. SYP-B4668]